MATEHEVHLSNGRLLRVHDSGPSEGLALLWHHGSPQTGRLLAPVAHAAAQRGMRLLSYARPSYGGSTPMPGRSVASAADDVREIMDGLGVPSFATMGASGGGPHALACAALLPHRVVGAVSISGPAPYTDEFDWFAGMAAPTALRTALHGRDARAAFAVTDEFDPAQFTDADWAALESRWASLGADAGAAEADGPDGLIDDDVALAMSWGFDVGRVAVPVLLVQGEADRVIPASHAHRLHALIPGSELWLRSGAGHISILGEVPAALDWVLRRAADSSSDPDG